MAVWISLHKIHKGLVQFTLTTATRWLCLQAYANPWLSLSLSFSLTTSRFSSVAETASLSFWSGSTRLRLGTNERGGVYVARETRLSPAPFSFQRCSYSLGSKRKGSLRATRRRGRFFWRGGVTASIDWSIRADRFHPGGVSQGLCGQWRARVREPVSRGKCLFLSGIGYQFVSRTSDGLI